MAESIGAFDGATGRRVADSEQENLPDKPRYRRFQYDLIAPHCGRSVLEVGAGLGEFAAQFTGRDRIVVTDVDSRAVHVLKHRFADRPEVDVLQLDVGGHLLIEEPVETVVVINVLEHFDDHAGLLENLSRLVSPGGNIVIWVPGYPALYGDFDRRVGHVRRYTPSTVAGAVRAAGLQVETVKPVNLLGGLAWWAAVRTGGAGAPKSKLVDIYDRLLIPATRTWEQWLPIPFGQSVLCVGRVPNSSAGLTESP